MDIRKIKVENMLSSEGRAMPNQFLIYTQEGTYFQSYETIIAFADREGQIFLDADNWACSSTTGKYRNLFLSETIRDTRAKIEAGVYILTNLNQQGE